MTHNTYWITAACIAIIMLILAAKEWWRFRSTNELDRSLFYMTVSTLVSCLPITLYGVSTTHGVTNKDVLFPLQEVSRITSVLNFYFWLRFNLEYLNIRRLHINIVLTLTGVIIGVGIIILSGIITMNHPGNAMTMTAPDLWLLVAVVYTDIMLVLVILYSLRQVALHRQQHTKSYLSYESSIVAAIVPLIFTLVKVGDDFVYSMGIASSCLILYIYVVSFEREGLQLSKKLFLENMSHEIRTSLNSVYGFAQLLCLPEGTWSREERDSYASNIRNSYNMLDMLLNDLMVSTRYDSHNYTVSVTTTDVMKSVTDGINALSVCMPSSVQVSLTSDLPEGFTIQSDGRRIRQIVQNLISNVCQYIIKGMIMVHLSQVDGQVEISVAANVPAAPDKNYRAAVEKSQIKHKTGRTLRLQICQKLATLLGGYAYRDDDYDHGIRYVTRLSTKDHGKVQARTDPSSPFDKAVAAKPSTVKQI